MGGGSVSVITQSNSVRGMLGVSGASVFPPAFSISTISTISQNFLGIANSEYKSSLFLLFFPHRYYIVELNSCQVKSTRFGKNLRYINRTI